MEQETIKVLDKGYVRIIDKMGSDLGIVNAARASFEKESQIFSDSDAKLIRFLMREGHYSPFRHAFLQFEFKAPLMVARQHWKYVVGSDHTMDAWNEGSRRYVTSEPEFYVPENWEWRSAPDNRKQGSGEPLSAPDGELLTKALEDYITQGEYLYNWAIADMKVAPEQARLLLPAYGMYVYYRWTGSIQSITHFLAQRLAADAQDEITAFALATHTLGVEHFPVVFDALIGEK